MDDNQPKRPQDIPPIRTQQDLENLWRLLMVELRFSRPQLWLALIDGDDRVTPVVTNIEDLPAQPDATAITNLIDICASLLQEEVPGGSAAFLYTRPGPGPAIARDLAWGRGLLNAARQAGVPCRPVHFACDDELHVMSLDDLGLAEPA